MTDTAAPDAERTERLARLRERRTSGDDPAATAELELSTVPSIDARAERLANLQQRRVPVASPVDVTAEMPGVSTPTAPSDTGRRRRRRAPATSAKIVTIGASATAMFGMIAGYGVADGLASDAEPSPTDSDLVAAPVATNLAEIPPASPSATPIVAATSTPAPAPHIIVVVVDGETGQTLSTTNVAGDLATDLTVAGAATDSDAPASEATRTAPAPVAVDLAVPAPPRPTPAPAAPASVAVPTAPPQATSDGS